MTTRRGLFGWIAGALALGAGVKPTYASGGIVDVPIGFVGEVPCQSWATLGAAPLSAEVFTDAVMGAWNEYRIVPTQIIISADAAARLALHGQFDPLGIRRRQLVRRWRAECPELGSD